MDIEETHFCKKCTCTKPISEFSKVKSTYKGKTYVNLQSSCKECIRKNWSEWKSEAKQKCTEEWHPTKSPVSWASLRGHSTIEKHVVYPMHSCGRRYMEQLGCLLCKKSEISIKTMVKYQHA